MEVIKVQVDQDNMELKMFKNSEGKYCVRLRDLDAQENAGLVKCPTLELAEKYWNKFEMGN